NVLVDTSFLIALLSQRDLHHDWAVRQARRYPRPWQSCEAALSEAFHLLGAAALPSLGELLQRRTVIIDFVLDANIQSVIHLMRKYSNIPMSLADACLVRMSEILSDVVVLTTDSDFRIYRRHSRQVIPSEIP